MGMKSSRLKGWCVHGPRREVSVAVWVLIPAKKSYLYRSSHRGPAQRARWPCCVHSVAWRRETTRPAPDRHPRRPRRAHLEPSKVFGTGEYDGAYLPAAWQLVMLARSMLCACSAEGRDHGRHSSHSYTIHTIATSISMLLQFYTHSHLSTEGVNHPFMWSPSINYSMSSLLWPMHRYRK